MVSFPRLVHGEAHFSLLLPPFALKTQNETLKIHDGKAITGESVVCIRGKCLFPVGDTEDSRRRFRSAGVRARRFAQGFIVTHTARDEPTDPPEFTRVRVF